jgi:hypothetical protein
LVKPDGRSRLHLVVRVLTCLALVAAPAPAHAQDEELPRSVEPAVEPVARTWRRQASETVTRAELYFQGSPLGWATSSGRQDFGALARIGAGVSRTSTRTAFGAFAAYEVSTISLATFSAHAMLQSRRGWGGSAGALVEVTGHLGASVAGCWRAACLEVQLRDHADRGRTFATWLHVTIPILAVVDDHTSKRRTE